MSEETKIQWATHTFNPWEGCTKVSPGCAHCYAEARNHRFGNDNWGKGKPRRRTSAATWRNPVKWDNAAEIDETEREAMGFNHSRPRVFPSLCDWLDDEVPVEWLADFLKLIHATPNLDWLLLTKRPENWALRLNAVARLWACDGGYRETPEAVVYHDLVCPWRAGEAPDNVWVGVSVEDQPRADERIPELLKIPARVRFLSGEPLLRDIELEEAMPWKSEHRSRGIVEPLKSALRNLPDVPGVDWVIVGGESGPKARPCNVKWVRSVVRQCKAAGVPCFVKQLGKVVHGKNTDGFDGESASEWPMGTDFTDLDPMEYQGAPVRIKLRDTKGGDPSEWPEDLRVREFPQLQSPNSQLLTSP